MSRMRRGSRAAGDDHSSSWPKNLPPAGGIRITTPLKDTMTTTNSNPIGTAKKKNLRGLLRLVEGQIQTASATAAATISDESPLSHSNRNSNSNDSPALVSVYRYHGETLRTSQGELQNRKGGRRRRRQTQTETTTEYDHEHNESLPTPLLYSSITMPFAEVVKRHRFVAFFVVQGWRSVVSSTKDVNDNESDAGCIDYRYHYSKHTLNLRRLLAREYHDAMTTFVVDLTSSDSGSPLLADEETGLDSLNTNENNAFCRGTGFCLLPTSSNGTLPTLFGISRVPSVVVVDTHSGRKLSRDALLAMERNDPHVVVNRWQSGHPSGLTCGQSLCAFLACQSEQVPCCAVQ